MATLGQRLAAGVGPSGVQLLDVVGDGELDLVVTNGQQGTVRTLTGLGAGFFNDTNPVVAAVAPAPIVQQTVLDATRGLALLADGSLVQFNPLTGIGSAVADEAGPISAFQCVRVLTTTYSSSPNNFAEIAMRPVSQVPGSVVPSRHDRGQPGGHDQATKRFNTSQNAYSEPGCARGYQLGDERKP